MTSTSSSPLPMLRADLHVHSRHSLQSGNLRFLKSRDCYSSPDDVYRVARARGMGVVTITDHDSVRGCLELLDRYPDAPDIFVSEEVSCRFPDGGFEVHLGVYGTNEALHDLLQPLRRNVFDVCAALREAGVFFSLNHPLHFYRGQVSLERYLRLLAEVPAVETRNGTMLRAHNELAAVLADRWPAGLDPPPPWRPTGGRSLAHIGGSDAHTLRRIGRTWTQAPGRNAREFLHSLAHGRAGVGGDHGGAAAVAADAYGVIGAYVASLLGFGPRDHAIGPRIACVMFAIASLPAQFLPIAIAAAGKSRERREVQRARLALAAVLSPSLIDTEPEEASA